jgi:hypothetical protein
MKFEIMLSNTLFMKTANSSISACRNCRYYVAEGRRGGHCNQLSVAVQSAWKACSLAIPPFAPAWDNLEEIIVWQRKALEAQEALTSSLPQVEAQPAPTKPIAISPKPTQGIKALWM